MCLQPDAGPYIGLGGILQRIVKILDYAFALSLRQRVMGGYEWLVQQYSPGDKVYLFGSSALHDLESWKEG
jgi:hypothetical protein